MPVRPAPSLKQEMATGSAQLRMQQKGGGVEETGKLRTGRTLVEPLGLAQRGCRLAQDEGMVIAPEPWELALSWEPVSHGVSLGQ